MLTHLKHRKCLRNANSPNPFSQGRSHDTPLLYPSFIRDEHTTQHNKANSNQMCNFVTAHVSLIKLKRNCKTHWEQNVLNKNLPLANLFFRLFPFLYKLHLYVGDQMYLIICFQTGFPSIFLMGTAPRKSLHTS